MILLASDQPDATSWFDEFHYRSKRANRVLDTWPTSLKVSVRPKNERCDSPWDELRDELVRAGYFDTSLVHCVVRIVDLLAWFAAGLLLHMWGYWWLGCAAHGVFGMRCGWVQHECGHGSFFGSARANVATQQAVMGVGLATSASLWNSMHNRHHAAPQHEQHDVDLRTAPLVSFYAAALDPWRGCKAAVWWSRLQAYTFVPITAGVLIVLTWTLYLHPKHVIRRSKYTEACFMLAAHFVRPCCVAMASQCGPAEAYVAGLWVPMWFTGMLLFGNFALSHTFTPTVAPGQHETWQKYALAHTVDISPDSVWCSYFMGFLNLQVVHHLYPTMPQYRQREVSTILRAFCTKHGYQYTTMPYWRAVRHTLRNLHDVGSSAHVAPTSQCSQKAD